MALPWATIKSLAIFFGPWLLPRIIGYYRRLNVEANRSQQHQYQQQFHSLVRPVSLRLIVVLCVLGLASAAWLLSSGILPGTNLIAPAWLAPPENIFALTQSRLQIPTEVIFTRLAAVRKKAVGGSGLTAADEALRNRFASLQSRLVYLQFGPSVLTDCPFCAGTGVDASSSNPTSTSPYAYLFYALADLLAGHLANLVLVALVTSPLLILGRKGSSSNSSKRQAPQTPGGAEAAAADDLAYDMAANHVRRFRVPATVAMLAVAVFDVAVTGTYNRQANARATLLSEIDFFFWNMRLYRGLASGVLLAALAVVLRYSATGQTIFHGSVSGPVGVVVFGSASEQLSSSSPTALAARVTAVSRGLTTIKSKINAGAIVKNTALRDSELRARTQAYWGREVLLVSEAMEEREVIEGVTDALQNRIDIQQIERDAETYAQSVIPVPVPASSVAASVQRQSAQPTNSGDKVKAT